MDDSTISVMMSSDNKEWETPQDLFNKLNDIFDFDLDVCATEENTKVLTAFINPDINSFTVPWQGTCWMNPPYGDPENICKKICIKKKCVERGYHNIKYVPGIIDWVVRAKEQAVENRSIVVCLLPCRPETSWFQVVWDSASAICFVKKRLTFEGAKFTAPFPSVIVVFGDLDPAREDFILEELSGIGNVIDSRNGGIIVYAGDRKI